MPALERLLTGLSFATLATLAAPTAHALDYYEYYEPPQIYLDLTYSDGDAHLYGNRHSYRPPYRHSHSFDGYARPQHHRYQHHHNYRPDKEFCEIRPARPGKPHYRP